LNESFSLHDSHPSNRSLTLASGTSSLDATIAAAALASGSSDALVWDSGGGGGGSSSSGSGLQLQRMEADGRLALVMQELEDMRQLLKQERDARALLERKVAVLSHWRDACDSDVTDCKGRLETMDHKLQIDVQRLSSKMSEERSKLSAGNPNF
jgi:hypothetical protein